MPWQNTGQVQPRLRRQEGSCKVRIQVLFLSCSSLLCQSPVSTKGPEPAPRKDKAGSVSRASAAKRTFPETGSLFTGSQGCVESPRPRPSHLARLSCCFNSQATVEAEVGVREQATQDVLTCFLMTPSRELTQSQESKGALPETPPPPHWSCSPTLLSGNQTATKAGVGTNHIQAKAGW